MLMLSDLNIIVKFYAYRIQQRIEELERLNYHFSRQEDSEADSQQYEFIAIISKYSHYVTRDEKEIKLAKKLAERVLQIYQFFKMKSNNQNLLSLIQQNVEVEMKRMTSQIPISLGELFTYIHLMTKERCVIKVPNQKRRVLSRSILKQPNKLQAKLVPAISLNNIQRKNTSFTSSKQRIKNPLPVTQKIKIEQTLKGIWGGLEVDCGYLKRVIEGKEHLLAKEMMKRNQKIRATIIKNDKKSLKAATEVSAFLDSKENNTILTDVKANSIKGIWYSKRRKQAISSMKHNPAFKENITIFC